MTLDEFVNTLKSGNDVISFPHSILSAPADVMRALGSAMSQLFPATETVAYAVQTSSFEYLERWSGTLEWLLLLSSCLLRVTAKIDSQDERPTFLVEQDLYRLTSLRGATLTTQYAPDLHVRRVEFAVAFSEGTVGMYAMPTNADALLELARLVAERITSEGRNVGGGS